MRDKDQRRKAVLFDGLSVQNREGREIAYLGLFTKNEGGLAIKNREGKEIAYLGPSEDGEGGLLKIENKKGEDHIQLAAGENGGEVIILNKTRGEVIQLYADEYGNGVVGAYNRKGVGRELKPGP